MGGRELQREIGSKAGLPGRWLGPARHRRSQGNRGEVLKEEMCAEGKHQRCPNQTANSMNCLRLGFSFHCWNTDPRSDTWSPGLLYGGQSQFREGMWTSLASNLGWLLQKSLGFPTAVLQAGMSLLLVTCLGLENFPGPSSEPEGSGQ